MNINGKELGASFLKWLLVRLLPWPVLGGIAANFAAPSVDPLIPAVLLSAVAMTVQGAFKTRKGQAASATFGYGLPGAVAMAILGYLTVPAAWHWPVWLAPAAAGGLSAAVIFGLFWKMFRKPRAPQIVSPGRMSRAPGAATNGNGLPGQLPGRVIHEDASVNIGMQSQRTGEAGVFDVGDTLRNMRGAAREMQAAGETVRDATWAKALADQVVAAMQQTGQQLTSAEQLLRMVDFVRDNWQELGWSAEERNAAVTALLSAIAEKNGAELPVPSRNLPPPQAPAPTASRQPSFTDMPLVDWSGGAPQRNGHPGSGTSILGRFLKPRR